MKVNMNGILAEQALAEAWKDQSIPRAQWNVARLELAAYAAGKAVAPFDALIQCLRKITFGPHVSILDVGASSGYYSEVLRIAGYDFEYTALDYSPAFKELATKLYPGIRFDIGDARELPYWTDSFDIVLSGCCLLHIAEYEKVISETARVASRFALFTKTPVLMSGPTQHLEKIAYGVPTLVIHFNEGELLDLFDRNGLEVVHQEDVSADGDVMYRTYLARKKSFGEREWERA